MQLNDDAGALRATNNKGLQPAMDFILEHNDDPIPDATSGVAATPSAQPHSEPIVIDEHQMFRVREDIQNYSTRQLPRGEEWARSVRGVHGGGAFSH